MLNSIITSLVIAAISGITFLAYKHPNAYNRLYLYLFAILLIVEAALIAWNSGISIVSSKLIELIPEAQKVTAKAIAESLSFSTPMLMFTLIGTMIFLVFLLFLPHLLADDKKKDHPENK